MLYHKIRQLLNQLSGGRVAGDEDSLSINDPTIIETFIADPDNTFLISFPRTGSHWLRMIMELYFKRPSLVRVFYYKKLRNYLTFHTHDLDLDVERSDVIYLYRDPVDTIFSQLRYHRESTDDQGRITFWSELYGKHLDKWLHRERFTKHKTILTYEGIKRDIVNEFAKVTQHFNQPLDKARFNEVVMLVTKKEVKRKTRHDQGVVRLEDSYEIARREFRKRYGTFVWDVLTRGRSNLLNYFNIKTTYSKEIS